MKFTKVDLLYVSSVLLLSLTPLYTIAFVIALFYVSRWNPWQLSFFDTYITRLVVNILLGSALIMMLAMFSWLLHIPLLPVVVACVIMGVYVFGSIFLPRAQAGKIASRDDYLSIGLALTGIIIVVVSFYLPKPSTAASVQLMTNGFDNAAHLSLIQTTFEGNGYVYGPYDKIKDSIGWGTLVAYPQGWHIANSFIWKGTGVSFFSTPDRSLAINMYVVTIMCWYTIALFTFIRATLYIIRLTGQIALLRQPGIVIGFIGAHLLLQLVLFWGVFAFGFATFTGALAFMSLLSALLLGIHEVTYHKRHFLFAAAIGCVAAGIGLSWLLPVPVVLAMIVLAYAPFLTKSLWQKYKFMKRQVLGYALIALLSIIPIIAIVVISRLFTTQPEQINDEGGIFAVSVQMAVLLLGVALYCFLRQGSKQAWLSSAMVALVTPQIIFVSLLYVYQLSTIGHTAYFFTKSLAIAVLLIGLFFVPAFVQLLGKLSFGHWRQLYVICVALVLLGSSLFVTNQDTASARLLLERGSKMERTTADVFARLAANGEIMHRHVIVFTKFDYPGDVNGNVLSTALNTQPPQCVGDSIWAITAHAGDRFPYDIDNCVKMHNEKVTIITSPETKDAIANLHNPNIVQYNTSQ